MQESKEHIAISVPVKRELERRKKILAKKIGRKVSFDYLMRKMLGWV